MTKALITGVSSGIGRAQAEALLKAGYTVYGVDKGDKPDLTGDFHFLQRDLQLDLQPVKEWCPQVELLCNTAGILDAYQPLLDQSYEVMQEVFDINYWTPVELTRLYLPGMLDAKKGIIINMCSIASHLAGGGGAAYTSSKHALAGFTRQLALDYARDGIQVFGLAPGAVQTGMTAADFEPGGLADWVASETPIGRWIQPEEIAAFTCFLASGQASAMQGEILTLDGGWSLK